MHVAYSLQICQWSQLSYVLVLHMYCAVCIWFVTFNLLKVKKGLDLTEQQYISFSHCHALHFMLQVLFPGIGHTSRCSQAQEQVNTWEKQQNAWKRGVSLS